MYYTLGICISVTSDVDFEGAEAEALLGFEILGG